MHFGAQARLVHHGIDSAEQIHIEETGIALIPGKVYTDQSII